MAHIYFSFDFATDEEKAQQARHKLEMWKQAFRLDKKMLYKFERESEPGASSASAAEKSEEEEKAGKGKFGGKKKRPSGDTETTANGKVKLYLRLAFSAHEKMSEDRLLKRFSLEEPFREMSPKPVKDGARFAELQSKFESLD